MVLGKIKNLAAALAITLGSYGVANAQEYNNSITNETTYDKEIGITREVARINTNVATLDYAIYPHSKKVDVLQLGINLPKDFGVKYTQLGNQQHIFEAWKTFKLGEKTTLTFDAGKGLEKDSYQWGLASVDHPNFYVLASMIKEGKFEGDMQNEFHGAVSANLKGVYVGFGVQGFGEKGDVWKQRYVLSYTNEDFGSTTFAFVNPNDNSWFFKSQNAYGDISKGFYNRDTWNQYILAEFTAGPFIPNVFQNSTSKGNWTMELSGSGNDKEGMFKIIPGMGTNIVNWGLGPNVKTLFDDEKTTVGLSALIYKDFSILKDKVKGYVMAEYNSQTGDIDAHAKVSYRW